MKSARKGFRPRRQRGKNMRSLVDEQLLVIPTAGIDPISQYYGKGPPHDAFANKSGLPSDFEMSLYRDFVRGGRR